MRSRARGTALALASGDSNCLRNDFRQRHLAAGIHINRADAQK